MTSYPARRILPLCLLAPTALALATPAVAQLPDGTIATVQFEQTSWTQGPGSGPGSLNLIHPLTGANTSVPNLPAGLTGSGNPSSGINGAMSVAIRESDGLVAVGEVNEFQGQSLAIHLLRFSGYSLVHSQRIVVGTVQHSLFANTPFGSIDQLSFLPDGNLIYSARGVLGYVNTPLGHLDVAAGTATPLPVTLTPSGTINALCTSRDGSKIYFGTFTFLSGNSSTEFWETSAAGGNIRSITVRPGIVTAMVERNDGKILASMADNTQNIAVVDPVTNSHQTIFTNINTATSSYSLNGIGYEPSTGNILVCTNGTDTRLFRVAPNGSALDMGRLASGWPSGIATLPNPRRYGAPTDRPNHAYRVEVTPNPGGWPRVGNGQFQLRIRGSAPQVAPGFLGLSLAPAQPALQLGFALHIDPTALLTDPIPLPQQATMTVPFPIPNTGAARGLQVFAQGIFLTPVGVAATEGVSVTVL